MISIGRMAAWLSNVVTALIRRGLSISIPIRWTGYSVSKWPNFTDQEVQGLDPTFVDKLQKARTIAGIPFRISSGFRSPEKNQSVIGAVPDSSHLKGLAADLRVSSSHDVALIIDACKQAGIDRRGIYVDKSFAPVHVHVDADPDKIADVIFIKQERN